MTNEKLGGITWNVHIDYSWRDGLVTTDETPQHEHGIPAPVWNGLVSRFDLPEERYYDEDDLIEWFSGGWKTKLDEMRKCLGDGSKDLDDKRNLLRNIEMEVGYAEIGTPIYYATDWFDSDEDTIAQYDIISDMDNKARAVVARKMEADAIAEGVHVNGIADHIDYLIDEIMAENE